MLRLEGIVPPVVTPLAEDERVDGAALERQLERLLAGGVHGIYFLGSTGEQPALRDSERRRAIEIAKGVVRGRVPLVVGTMAGSTARAIENIQAAEAAGADAVAVTPPHYYPSHGPGEQLAHYRACAAAARVPVVIYNIPLTTKVMLSPETIATIAALPNVVAIKDSSGDFTHFLRILALLRDRPDFSCLVGSPPLIGAAVLFGAEGGVPGLANLDPALLVSLYDAARRGAVEEVYMLQSRVVRLMQVVSHGAPIACIKTALELMGVCSARACAPTQPVTAEARDRIRELLREMELL
jgi:4-hydroxy-tetrahydrodipicolinate synthase